MKITKIINFLDAENVDKLRDLFELEYDELMVYLQITVSRGLTASRVANILALDRTRTYRITGKLQAHGYINSTATNPVTFEAVKPEDIMDLIASKHTNIVKRCDSVDFDEIFANIKVQKVSKNVQFSYISGFNTYLARVKQLLSKCEFAIMLLSQETLKSIYYTDVPEVIKRDKDKFTILSRDLTLVGRLKPGKKKKINTELDQDVVITDSAVLFSVGPMNPGSVGRSFYYNNSDASFLYTTNPFLINIASKFLESLQ